MSGPSPHESENPPAIGRRTVLTGAVASAVVAGGAVTAHAAPRQPNNRRPGSRKSWVGSWAASPSGVAESAVIHLADQTIRNVVHTSVGGRSLRLRLTNEFGSEALQIGEVRVAYREGSDGYDIIPASDRQVTFGGSAMINIPAGSPAVSDPVELRVADGADLVVSIHLPERTAITTQHALAMQANAIADGNVTADRSVTPTEEPQRWYVLSGVAVEGDRRSAAVVALGDSITDGADSEVGANHRWPDLLAARFRSRHSLDHLGVVNAGISGNRLLYDPNPPEGSEAEEFAPNFGPSALHRFDRDVIAQPGAEFLLTLIGVNDLGHPGTVAPESEVVSADDLINGHRQLIARAHAAGLQAFGCTMLPFKDDALGFWSEENGAKRRALNEWMLTSGEYDAVIDFAAAVADPDDPDRLRADFDLDDGLHPNDAGMAAMAEAIPLSLFH